MILPRWNFANELEKRAYLAPRLKRLYPDFQTGGAYYRELIRRTLPDTGTVLDIGCGRGGIISEFARPGLFIIGVDPDAEALSENRVVQEKVWADVNHLPFGDRTIDVVAAEFVLEHLIDPDQAFREIQRVLRPGGSFVFLTPNAWNPIMGFSRLTPTAWHGWLRENWLHKAEKTFPAYYRANTMRKLIRLADQNKLAVQEIFQAGNPEYLALAKPLATPAILMERLLDRPALRALKMYLVGYLTKLSPD